MLIAVDAIVRASDANNEKLRITVTREATDFGGATNINVHIGVTGPLTTVKALNTTTGNQDFNLDAAASGNILVDLEKVTGGSLANGNYTVTVFVQNLGPPLVGGSGDMATFTNTFNFQPLVNSSSMASLTATMNCYENRLLVQDRTDYTGYTVGTRAMTTKAPTIAGVTTPADVVTSDVLSVIPVSYEYTTYTISLLTPVSKQTVNSNFTYNLLEEVSASLSKEIVCDLDLCDLMSCIKTVHDDFYTEAQNKGGVLNTESSNLAAFTHIMSTMALHNQYVLKQDVENQQSTYQQLKTLLNACNQNCPTPTQPKKLSVPASILYTYNETGQAWLQVSATGTFNTDYQDGTLNLEYRQLPNHWEFRGQIIRSGGAVANPASGTTFQLISGLTLLATNRSRIPIYKGGQIVGAFYRNAGTGNWDIDVGTGFDNSVDQYISGLIPIV